MDNINYDRIKSALQARIAVNLNELENMLAGGNYNTALACLDEVRDDTSVLRAILVNQVRERDS